MAVLIKNLAKYAGVKLAKRWLQTSQWFYRNSKSCILLKTLNRLSAGKLKGEVKTVSGLLREMSCNASNKDLVRTVYC